jgi:hypothetical protein
MSMEHQEVRNNELHVAFLYCAKFQLNSDDGDSCLRPFLVISFLPDILGSLKSGNHGNLGRVCSAQGANP